MLVTSFSPTRIEAQDKAVQSWKQQGLSFRAVQSIGEDYAKDFTTDIDWVQPNLHWSKPTPSLVDIFKTIDSPTILINSDIEIEEPINWVPQDNILKIGLRTDYCKQFTQLNKYGIDVYLITPEMIPHLSQNNLWALGIPGWDYWVAYKLLTEGYQLDIVKDGFLHAAHPEQWNKDDYRRCSRLLEFEFDVPVQDISDTLQDLTDRKHLNKRRVYTESH